MGSEIVTEFAKDFSLDELEKGEKMDFQNLPLVRPSEMVNVEAGQINDKAAEMDEEDDMMEEENDENILPKNVEVFAKKGQRQERKFQEKEKEDPLFKLEGNMRLEKASKIIAKKNKKERKRANRLGETLSDQMNSVFAKLNE